MDEGIVVAGSKWTPCALQIYCNEVVEMKGAVLGLGYSSLRLCCYCCWCLLQCSGMSIGGFDGGGLVNGDIGVIKGSVW